MRVTITFELATDVDVADVYDAVENWLDYGETDAVFGLEPDEILETTHEVTP